MASTTKHNGQAMSHAPGLEAQNASRSTLINRNVTVSGRRTSMRLETSMWAALEEICRREQIPMNQLATEIARDRLESSLTAAIRVFVMEYFRAAASEFGHRRAGHGERNAHLLYRRNEKAAQAVL